jgi:hypothetical protein
MGSTRIFFFFFGGGGRDLQTHIYKPLQNMLDYTGEKSDCRLSAKLVSILADRGVVCSQCFGSSMAVVAVF